MPTYSPWCNKKFTKPLRHKSCIKVILASFPKWHSVDYQFFQACVTLFSSITLGT